MSEDLQIPVAVDLTSCDREPIHIPGAILPHGAMLVLGGDSLSVLQAAGDIQGFFDEPVDALLGRSIDALFAPDQVARLRNLAATSDLARPRHLLDPALRVLADRPLDASVHKSDGLLVIELETADANDRHAGDPLACVQQMIDGLEAAPSLQALCQTATRRVMDVTGYDRVMIYRFMDDGAGWVFAESRRDDLVPFLDLHYPASDIPRQARELYLKNWLRLITQVDYDPAPLVPALNPLTGRALDMSHATLRDVSPIHREYLRNMGVDASMSISIVREGKLWGLIACHHYSPRRLPRHLRAACELFGSIFSLQLDARERAEQFEARLASRQLLYKLMRNLAEEDDYAQGLIRQSPNLLDYIQAGGVSLRVSTRGGLVLRLNNTVTSLGETPSQDQIAALTDWLTVHMGDNGGIFATDRLGEVWPPARAFADVGSGLLALSVSREPRDFILWFRPEVVETVSWGGDPTKPVELGPHGERLTPRKSFEVWQETVRGRAIPWLPSDGDAAFDLRVSLLEVVLRRIDAAARERERAHRQEKLLMAELDHRVKNTLANIQALVMQTSRSASSLTEFVDGLDGRIRSMAKAHSLLTASRWQGASLRALLCDELEAYDRDGKVASLIGPEASLTPKAALALSLVVHELTTNAAKYGALSSVHGRVAVSWEIGPDGGIGLLWQETGGPPVQPPRRRGFGSRLIDALSVETGGRSIVQFPTQGVQCRIELPATAVASLSAAPGDPNGETHLQTRAVGVGKAPHRILVVEDSALVLMMIKDMFADLGWQMVGPATRLADALELARREAMDAALLDINLDGELSLDVAVALKERGVPFIFSTGYDGGTVLPEQLAGSPVIGKPFEIATLERHLRELISSVGIGGRASGQGSVSPG